MRYSYTIRCNGTVLFPLQNLTREAARGALIALDMHYSHDEYVCTCDQTGEVFTVLHKREMPAPYHGMRNVSQHLLNAADAMRHVPGCGKPGTPATAIDDRIQEAIALAGGATE